MTASVKIQTQEIKDALVVSVNALQEEEDGTYVDLVVNEETNETVHKKVTVKTQDSTRAVIKKGLQEGDVVIVSSFDFEADDEDFDEDYDEGDYDAEDFLDEGDFEEDIEIDDPEDFEE